MTDQELNTNQEMEEFWKLVDSFIHLANEHCEASEREKVSSALVYAAARFNAFVVASNSYNEQEFADQRQEATEFFENQYSRMFQENLDDYENHYKQYTETPLN